MTRLRGPVAFWAAAGVALLASHDLIYLVQVGPGRELTHALRTAGHGYWGAASLALVLVGLAATVVIGLRMRTLRRRAAALGVGAIRDHRSSYPARWLSTWVRLLVLVAGLFVVQESVEHFIAHGHVVGIGAVVGPESPLALPVMAAIAAIAALFVARATETEAGLLRAIAAALRPRRKAPLLLPRPPAHSHLHRRSVLADCVAGRAPPRMLAIS